MLGAGPAPGRNLTDNIQGSNRRLRYLSTETIRLRLNELGTGLYKEASIALRQILEERDSRQGALQQ
jgi:hypothetical protein